MAQHSIVLGLFMMTVLSLLDGSSAFLLNQRLKGRFQRDRRNIRPNIILVLTDDQDVELDSCVRNKKFFSVCKMIGRTSLNLPLCRTSFPSACNSGTAKVSPKMLISPLWTENITPSPPNYYNFEIKGLSDQDMRNRNNSSLCGAPLGRAGAMVPPRLQGALGHGAQPSRGNVLVILQGLQVKELVAGMSLQNTALFPHPTFLHRSLKFSCVSTSAAHMQLDTSRQSACAPLVHNTPSYNYAPNPDKHWIMRYTGPMKPIHMEFTNMLQRKRLQTLMSVDDSMEMIYNMLAETGELENTYIIYTADHGYHIGQFGLVKGKSMPYEFDVRVPFYVRGPNVEAGSLNPHIVLNIDLAPTILDIAGLDIPSDMDGKSILKLLDSERPVNRFHLKKKMKVWRDSFLVERGKLLHKRENEKVDAQEENFLPKYQRVKDLCQRAEYQTACEQLGQKWQCVEDASGKLKLHKCKGMANLAAAGNGKGASNILPKYYNRNSEDCNCEENEYKLSHVGQRKKLFSRRKFKPSYVRNRSVRSVSVELDGAAYNLGLEDGYQPILPRNITKRHKVQRAVFREEEDRDVGDYSGTGSITEYTAPNLIKVTHRCYILENDTVQCDTDLYRSLQAWKDHKLHIDHEIETLQNKIKNLREVRGHLKKKRPEECDCNKLSYHSKHKSKLRHKGSSLHPFKKALQEKDRLWLLREQRRKKKLRKLLKRIKNNDTCSMPGLTCFTHDNQHWQTAPLWTLGPFCACTSANNNTYWCLRTINETHNFLFCEFATGFLEYFDLNTDPYQLINAVNTLDRDVLNQLHVQLMELRSCRGYKQCNPRTRNMDLGLKDGSYEQYRQFQRRKWPDVKRPSSAKSLGQLWEGWEG
ncbi:SULF2 sulfatase, partial [Gymnorhina tibicen]|nr:SULF2 sulfatase [Gymnorhina tibicen]